jgi:transcriptional regulator with XRE-family HTH domain
METEKKDEKKRRCRRMDAKDTYVPGEAPDMNGVFRKRLTYLMNGNSALGKPVNLQELADAVGVSRPAIRKYLRPREHGEPTTPSAATVCRIARYFRTTPDFLLGFDREPEDTVRAACESELYNALGLNQETLEKLRALRALREDPARAEQAAALMAMLDKQTAGFADDALKLLGAVHA